MAKRRNIAPLVGAAAVILLMMSSKSAPSLSPEEQRAHDKFKELAEKTGNDAYHPDKHPLEEIVRGFQVSVGLSDPDGVFDEETESALEEVLVGLIPK
jgi:hypothetical protein